MQSSSYAIAGRDLASFFEDIVHKFGKQFGNSVVLVYEILKCLQMPIRDDV
jgi:hypothetical protein